MVKLSNKTWVYLAIILVVITAAILAWKNGQQMDQEQQLRTRLTQSQNTLANLKIDDLVVKKETYTKELAQYSSQIESTKSKLSSTRDSIDATDALLADARSYNINITDIKSSGFSTESLAGRQYETLGISITANGKFQYLSNFISSLSKVFPTSIIKSSTVDQSSQGIYNASINLVIYNYKGN
jgi:Tfp pilus assembly protein PilO